MRGFCRTVLCMVFVATGASQVAAANERILVGSGVRIRAEPKKDGAELLRLGIGTVVNAAEETRSPEGSWYKVTTSDGKSGYVFGAMTAPFEAQKKDAIHRELI